MRIHRSHQAQEAEQVYQRSPATTVGSSGPAIALPHPITQLQTMIWQSGCSGSPAIGCSSNETNHQPAGRHLLAGRRLGGGSGDANTTIQRACSASASAESTCSVDQAKGEAPVRARPLEILRRPLPFLIISCAALVRANHSTAPPAHSSSRGLVETSTTSECTPARPRQT
jgi:hypothetical protein